MGCFDKCMRCLNLVPWASLIATVVCWAGVALFCGAGHEALTFSYELIDSTNITGFSWNSTVTDEVFASLKYAIYGIAPYMFVISMMFFVDGILATRAVKSDYDEGCRSSTCGLCIGVFYSAISYFTALAWLVMTGFAVVPINFFVVAQSQCNFASNTTNNDAICIDLIQAGLMHPADKQISGYGRVCGDDLISLCESPSFLLTYQLFVITLVGSGLVLISLQHYLMCLSANFAYMKMAAKLAVYQDAKYREEMELNDIINTARSNERLTNNRY